MWKEFESMTVNPKDELFWPAQAKKWDKNLKNASPERQSPTILILTFGSNVNTHEKWFLLTSNRVFSYYQGESTIFDKRNFLFQTPDTKNL